MALCSQGDCWKGSLSRNDDVEEDHVTTSPGVLVLIICHVRYGSLETECEQIVPVGSDSILSTFLFL